MSTRKVRPKAVKAWALVSPDGRLLPHFCSSSYRYLMHNRTQYQRVIRVEIRPLPARRRKAKRVEVR